MMTGTALLAGALSSAVLGGLGWYFGGRSGRTAFDRSNWPEDWYAAEGHTPARTAALPPGSCWHTAGGCSEGEFNLELVRAAHERARNYALAGIGLAVVTTTVVAVATRKR